MPEIVSSIQGIILKRIETDDRMSGSCCFEEENFYFVGILEVVF